MSSAPQLAAPDFDLNGRAAPPFHEDWYLKLNTPDAQHSLWIRIHVLASVNGFRQVAEVWAAYATRSDAREVTQLALKQAHDVGSFRYSAEEGVKLGQCSITGDLAQGRIRSKGREIAWDLRFVPANPVEVDLVPRSLGRIGRTSVLGMRVQALSGDLRVTGNCTIDGREVRWNQAPGMLGHSSGRHYPRSWIWGHSNVFVDERGQPADFVFEGISAKARSLGPVPLPNLSCFYFHHKGKTYPVNSTWEAFRARSKHSFTEWRFQADQGVLSFRGRASAEHRDFAGLTMEDTNGSPLYCASTRLSNLEVHVYRRGKLDSAYYSIGTTAFDVVSPQKNPYVPLLL